MAEQHDPTVHVDEFQAAREWLADNREDNPQAAAMVEALLDKGIRFQRLWIDTVESMREIEVAPLQKELERTRELLTTESAERMEEALRLHYKEPVRPVSVYCNAFRAWHGAIADALERGDFDPDTAKRWIKVRDALNELQLPIGKSNLLWRLIYLGESLRTEKCSEHKGHWVGCYFDKDRLCECQSGYDVTGWLPDATTSTTAQEAA